MNSRYANLVKPRLYFDRGLSRRWIYVIPHPFPGSEEIAAPENSTLAEAIRIIQSVLREKPSLADAYAARRIGEPLRGGNGKDRK